MGMANGQGATRAQRAAAQQRAAARKEHLREWLIVGGVIVAVLAVVLTVVLWPEGDDSRDANAPGVGSTDSSASDGPAGQAPSQAPGGDLQGEVTENYGFAFGDPDAPHRVIIYEDFLCPFCGALETATTDDLSRLIDAGEVQVEYRVFNLLGRVGDYSLRAASAMAVVMQEAGPRAAKTFHDLLFADQPSESGQLPDDEWLIDNAVVAGADEEAVREDIENQVFADWVDDATQAAGDNGVSTTPTVFVDGQRVGGESIDELSAAILGAVG